MAVKLVVDVPAPDDILRDYGVGALLRWESSATELGAYTEGGTTAVISGQYQYELNDTAGSDTTFYRTRFSNAAASLFSSYSPVMSVSAPDTYAGIDELLLGVPHVPTDTRTLARMATALREAKNKLDHEIGYDFNRHPNTGTEVRTVDGPPGGGIRLHVHGGIISCSQVRVTLTQPPSWVTLDAADWVLDGDGLAGEPYFHILLTGTSASFSEWPDIVRGIELTGAFGWSTIPSSVKNAEKAWARQDLAADPSFPGGIVGADEFGRPVGPNRLPDAVWRLKRWHVEKFMGCSV